MVDLDIKFGAALDVNRGDEFDWWLDARCKMRMNEPNGDFAEFLDCENSKYSSMIKSASFPDVCIGVDYEKPEVTVRSHCDNSGNHFHAAILIHEFFKEFQPGSHCIFGWSSMFENDITKVSGGAVFVDGDEFRTFDPLVFAQTYLMSDGTYERDVQEVVSRCENWVEKCADDEYPDGVPDDVYHNARVGYKILKILKKV